MRYYSTPYKKYKRKKKLSKFEKERKRLKKEKRRKKSQELKQKVYKALDYQERVKIFAKRVCQKRNVKSEEWFFSLWKACKDVNDLYNEAFGIYIPDIINHEYKYIIEIDGSIHDNKDQWKKDIKKNEYYSSRGYMWYRVKAYNFEQFDRVKEEIIRRRNNWYDPRVNSLKNKVSGAI